MDDLINSIDNNKCFNHVVKTKRILWIFKKNIYLPTPHWLIEPMGILLNSIPDFILKSYGTDLGMWSNPYDHYVYFHNIKYSIVDNKVDGVAFKFDFMRNSIKTQEELLITIRESGIKSFSIRPELKCDLDTSNGNIEILHGYITEYFKKVFEYLVAVWRSPVAGE